jgi:outer membrane lipase/esterase
MAIMGERDVGLVGRGGAVSELQFTVVAIASSFHASGGSVNCDVRRRHMISDGHAYKTLGNVTAGALAAMLLCSGAAVHAQAAPAPPPGNLPQIPNQTPVQQPTSNVVQSVCNSFVANAPTFGAPSDTGTPEQRLWSSCRKMVQTANQLAGKGSTANSLGLSEGELLTGVQAVAPVQMNAQKQMTTEASRNNMVFSRLLDLRGGARGVGLTLNNMDLSPSSGASDVARAGPGGRGGGASADPPLGERWGGFVNLGYSWGDVSQTSLQDGYDFSNWGVVAGVDYRVSANAAIGGAASYQKTKSDYANNLGSIKADTLSLAAYGTYYDEGFYLDGLLSYGWINYDTTRTINLPSNTAVPGINTVATASPSGNQWSAVVGGGYNFTQEAVTITPFGRLGYLYVKNKAFSEDEPVAGLGLAVDARTVDSLQSALGVRLQRAFGTSFGVVTPYATAQWNHEFLAQQSSITSKYVNDPFNVFFTIPTEDAGANYAVFTLGLSGQFERGIAAFVQYGTTAWLKNVSNQTLSLGVRIPF